MAILRQGNPNRICWHHSASSASADNIEELKHAMNQYDYYHSQKDWAEDIKTPGEHGYEYIEYHVAFATDGSELQLQDDKYVLYHATDNGRGSESFNLHGIAALIDGNYENEYPNEKQKEAAARYIARFEKKYNVDSKNRGHKETALTGTACPGRNIGTHDSGWLKEVIARANEITKNNLSTEPLNTETNMDRYEVGTIVSTKGVFNASVDWAQVEKDDGKEITVVGAWPGGEPFKFTGAKGGFINTLEPWKNRIRELEDSIKATETKLAASEKKVSESLTKLKKAEDALKASEKKASDALTKLGQVEADFTSAIQKIKDALN